MLCWRSHVNYWAAVPATTHSCMHTPKSHVIWINFIQMSCPGCLVGFTYSNPLEITFQLIQDFIKSDAIGPVLPHDSCIFAELIKWTKMTLPHTTISCTKNTATWRNSRPKLVVRGRNIVNIEHVESNIHRNSWLRFYSSIKRQRTAKHRVIELKLTILALRFLSVLQRA